MLAIIVWVAVLTISVILFRNVSGSLSLLKPNLNSLIMAFYPGPGLGGHCIPIDPFYLTWKAREYNYHTRLIELAGEINNSMPEYVITRAMQTLNEDGKALRGAKVAVLGVAYKKDIDDVRESPVLKIVELLEHHGADYTVVDPYVKIKPEFCTCPISNICVIRFSFFSFRDLRNI